MTQKSSILGKAEWLTSVDVALNGLFGVIALMIAYELGAMIFNPTHLTEWGFIKINWHFTNALCLLVMAAFVFAGILLWKPVKLGLEETSAKLWFYNLKQDYSKLSEALDTEEGKVLAHELLDKMKDVVEDKNTEKPVKVVHTTVQPDSTTDLPPTPWGSVTSGADVLDDKKSD